MNLRKALFFLIFLIFAGIGESIAERPSPSEGRTGLLIFGILVIVIMGVAVTTALVRKEGIDDDDDEDEDENQNS